MAFKTQCPVQSAENLATIGGTCLSSKEFVVGIRKSEQHEVEPTLVPVITAIRRRWHVPDCWIFSVCLLDVT